MMNYLSAQFAEEYLATNGISYLTKNIIAECGDTVKIDIVDSAGDERFSSLIPIFLKDSPGVILMFDLTSKISIQRLNYFLQLCADQNVNSLIIAGNKLDLVEKNPSSREVFIEDIAAFQEDANFNDEISYLEISGKDNPKLPFQ